jgi:FMN phosphatase YigB (HAD superfamily)
MVAERLSVSLSAESAAAVRKAASDAGMSVSGWVERTVGSIARRQAGLQAMDEYEAEHGAFTNEEREQARQALRELGLLEVRAAG